MRGYCRVEKAYLISFTLCYSIRNVLVWMRTIIVLLYSSSRLNTFVGLTLYLIFFRKYKAHYKHSF